DRVMVLCNGRHAGELLVQGKLDEARVLAWMGGAADVDMHGESAAARRHSQHSPRMSAVITASAPNDISPIALSARGLRAGARLRGVEFELRQGEILGVAGLQGHGQEELLDALAGYRKLDDGEITLDGAPIAVRSPRQMIDAGVCLVPNDRHRQGLWLDHSVEFNLAQVAANFQREPWRLRSASIRQLVDFAVKRLRIKTSDARQPVRALSGGNQQKVVIGRWLDRRIKVLLLSDPTKGVDVIARREIYEAIGALTEAGAAAIVYASDTDELLAVCDRLIVMYEGRVVAQLEGPDMNEARVTSALFGRSAA
ncbi:MAG: sugar ABC transporter ATP-binding protein, partial [Burkholderia sp.]|nr:sugar ABC transporter ATP-binding protein [Burkholderia sp.]